MMGLVGRLMLVLIIALALIVTALPAAGAGPAGTGIEDAVTLPMASAVGGRLAPHSSYWYQIMDDGKGIPLGILMNYWPTYSENNSNITFKVWTYDSRLMGWPYSIVGEGTRGSMPVGIKYWRGSPSGAGKVYYLQVVNDTDYLVIYGLAYTGDKEEAKFPTLLVMPADGGLPIPPSPPASSVLPTPPSTTQTAPVSKLYPDNRYTLGEEKKIGSYSLKLWKAINRDNRPGQGIATISGPAVPTIQVEDVYRLGDLTGKDLTGMGVPVAIIETFTGGAHCCFNTIVYELGNKPVKVLDTKPSNCGGRFQDIDGNGTYEFITCDDIFAYTYCSYAGSPKPRVILQYQPGQGYVLASPLFPEQYEPDIARDTDLAMATPGISAIGFDGTPKCAVLPLVLDYIYSGRLQDGLAALYQYYQYPDVDTFAAEILATSASSHLCPSPE